MEQLRPLEEINKSKYFTIKEASAYLGVTPWSFYSWFKKPELAEKLHRYSVNGYNVYLSKEELDDLIKIKESKRGRI